MPITAADIGPTYDLLLATRDATTLSCRNKDGKLVTVSQVAYMTTIDRNQQQHEETELAHKDQLIQLGSPNLSDRELEQWPQVTQGDWSGGTLQRILTGATPLTSFGAQSDPTRYWDGQGLIWPITDSQPTTGFQPPVVALTGTAPANVFPGTFGGSISGFSGSGWAALWAPSAANTRLLFQVGDTQNTLDNPFGVGVIPIDMAIGGGALWALTGGTGTAINLYTVNAPAGVLTARLVQQLTNTNTANSAVIGSVAAANVGNRAYVAVAYQYLDSGLTHYTSNIRLFDVTNQNSFAAPSATDLPLPFNQINGVSPEVIVTQLIFSGDSLFISLSDGSNSYIIEYSINSPTFSTRATISQPTAYLVANGGVLFILGVGLTPTPQRTTVHMYLLQGGSLQDIGSLTSPTPNFLVTSRPSAFGPYVVFTATDASFIHLFAYDVLRGRLFRGVSITYASISLTGGSSLAVVSAIRRGSPAQFLAEWGVVVQIPNSTGGYQELYWNVTSGANNVPLQLPCDIVSSLIDFTSSQPKLYRQIVIKFAPLPVSTAASIAVRVWLDKDPLDIITQGLSPDFSQPAISNGINGGVVGQTQLKLPINKIAVRLVYEVITQGGVFSGGNFVSAVRLQSIAIQAATGWVQTLMLDLAANLKTNGNTPASDCWLNQNIDSVVGYNFLRQLWRQKGGEVNAAFPNGDSGDWLIQDMHFDSPKPFGTSFRADQQAVNLKYVATVKLREDI